MVVEIESPGDESWEKLPFYAMLEVPEVWIIHRDTKAAHILTLKGKEYQETPAGPEGWVLSKETDIEMRPGKSGKLEIRRKDDDSIRDELP